MREIVCDRSEVHEHLKSTNIATAFEETIKIKKHLSEYSYSDKKSDEVESLKWTLKDMYHNKCAFCESLIENEVGDIEHYRPKNRNKNQAKKCDKTYSYYWLAFSWDNLLPSCSKCNGKKSNCFDILGKRAVYENETLEGLHYKTKAYNDLEKPKLLHPEHDTFESTISFSKKGKMISLNQKMKYTIRICDLNRINLLQSRRKIIGDFLNKLDENLVSFEKYIKKNNDNMEQCLEYFKPTITDFCNKSNTQYAYSLVNQKIKDNFEYFLNVFKYKEDRKDIILLAFYTYNEGI